MKKLSKVLVSLIFVFALFILFNTVHAASDFKIKNLDFNVVLNSDGSMNVTETWNVKIYGETNTLFKEFDLKSGQYNITDVKVQDITRKKTFNEINTLMYHVTTDDYYAMNNSNGLFEIAWGVNKDSGEISYEITYKVEDAVTKYNDCAELYWYFIGKDFSTEIENVTGRITLPTNVSNIDNLRVWGHGALNGEIERIDTRTVTFKVNPYFKGYGLEIRLAILEPEMFSLSSNTKNINKFESILSEEIVWADNANKEREKLKIQRTILGLASVMLSTGLGVMFIVFALKNNRKSKEIIKLVPSMKLDYYRDIPNEEEAMPAGAAFLYYYGKMGMQQHMPKVISASILNLALKKYIEMEVKTDDKRKEEVYININSDKDQSGLKESEKLVYTLLKTISKDNIFTMKDFEKYAKNHDTVFLTKISNIEKAAEKEQIANKNFDKKSEDLKNKYVGKAVIAIVAVIFYIIFTLAIILEINITFALISITMSLVPMIIYSIITFKLAGKLSGLTQKGIDEKEQWNGLKKYMEDFSLLNEREVPELVLWEKFLVYATVFGIADKVLKQLKVRYPEFSNEEYMRNTAYFHVMMHSNFNTSIVNSINDSVSKAYSSSMASSGGGSGGGFSGGGGGRWRRRSVEADAREIAENHEKTRKQEEK